MTEEMNLHDHLLKECHDAHALEHQHESSNENNFSFARAVYGCRICMFHIRFQPNLWILSRVLTQLSRFMGRWWIFSSWIGMIFAMSGQLVTWHDIPWRKKMLIIFFLQYLFTNVVIKVNYINNTRISEHVFCKGWVTFGKGKKGAVHRYIDQVRRDPWPMTRGLKLSNCICHPTSSACIKASAKGLASEHLMCASAKWR